MQHLHSVALPFVPPWLLLEHTGQGSESALSMQVGDICLEGLNGCLFVIACLQDLGLPQTVMRSAV